MMEILGWCLDFSVLSTNLSPGVWGKRKSRSSEMFLIIETEDKARFHEQLCSDCLGVFVMGIMFTC